MTTYNNLKSVTELRDYYNNELAGKHLKDLLADSDRNAALRTHSESSNLYFDYTHAKLDAKSLDLLKAVADETQVFSKVKAMFSGEKINPTENRSVLHVALRMPEGQSLEVDGKDVLAEVHEVNRRIADFSNKVRSGEIVGYTGKKLANIVAIGIGGSFLGPEFVYEALRFDATCRADSQGMRLRFLANVDPNDFFRATDGLDVESTLFVIVSKTFTTAETMLNARTCRKHIIDHFKKADANCDEAAVLSKHLCAVSTNLKATAEFGIKDENVFGFWEWVGGRFSVSSAVGLLPLSLFYGFHNM